MRNLPPAEAEKILIFGATSAIAQSMARLWASQAAAMYLVGRSLERLSIVRDDLVARGAAKVVCRELDFADYPGYDDLIGDAYTQLGGLSILLIAHGELTDQARGEADTQYLVEQLRVNLLTALVAISGVANRFEAQGKGTIIVIGSVAGDRGRQTNYVYGTAKAALATFSEGLRSRLAGSGVGVLLVKPGRVDTPMTAGLSKNRLYASPSRVAQDVMRALKRGDDEVYTPLYWRFLMLMIRAVPRRWYKRLRL